jgi:hypothetical protein
MALVMPLLDPQRALSDHDPGATQPDLLAADGDPEQARPPERVALLDRHGRIVGYDALVTSRLASGPAALPVAGSSQMPTVGLKNRA